MYVCMCESEWERVCIGSLLELTEAHCVPASTKAHKLLVVDLFRALEKRLPGQIVNR